MRRRLLVLNISATPSCRMLGLRVLPRSQGRVNFNWIDGTSKDVDNCPAKWWILRTYGVVASHTQKPSLITTPFPTQQVFRCGVQCLRRRDSRLQQVRIREKSAHVTRSSYCHTPQRRTAISFGRCHQHCYLPMVVGYPQSESRSLRY